MYRRNGWKNSLLKKTITYQVKKDLREMIVFAQHNLIKDAPFTRLDLLCCRNVMIYLTTELQRKDYTGVSLRH
jgi:two-component system CheB/CheR fusion protein